MERLSSSFQSRKLRSGQLADYWKKQQEYFPGKDASSQVGVENLIDLSLQKATLRVEIKRRPAIGPAVVDK
ncbi:hypothetical protein RHMOL_Rhmol12G0101400 [Rhododendron molle]|uniref:Uncharacterized protein n=1 Tax=Rhododendron molle TaxID=49168 RepID=A0ACC0LHN5_RHOML|nr:hypothetical protein RHMOL_Rhmol12G0101400 [Rhododendron molle]